MQLVKDGEREMIISWKKKKMAMNFVTKGLFTQDTNLVSYDTQFIRTTQI
jgi:hypothetical protein